MANKVNNLKAKYLRTVLFLLTGSREIGPSLLVIPYYSRDACHCHVLWQIRKVSNNLYPLRWIFHSNKLHVCPWGD